MGELESFILQVPNFDSISKSGLVDYFVYYLTVIRQQPSASPAEVKNCFERLRIEPYSNISAYLTEKSSRGKGKRYIKKSTKYILERSAELEIQKKLHTGPAKQETSYLLRNLVSELRDKKQQTFLQEAIDCYEIGAKRAAIVLVWILTVNHLFAYIFKNKLSEFNSVLAANTDRRVKITAVSGIDDFNEIPEGKFIEFCRSAKVISNDVRKILEEKLGTRNSAAHPSGITISEVKATDFVQDLVENVILKYPL